MGHAHTCFFLLLILLLDLPSLPSPLTSHSFTSHSSIATGRLALLSLSQARMADMRPDAVQPLGAYRGPQTCNCTRPKSFVYRAFFSLQVSSCPSVHTVDALHTLHIWLPTRTDSTSSVLSDLEELVLL